MILDKKQQKKFRSKRKRAKWHFLIKIHTEYGRNYFANMKDMSKNHIHEMCTVTKYKSPLFYQHKMMKECILTRTGMFVLVHASAHHDDL
jgi:hypothetical protein